MNKERVETLENELSQYLRKRRIILGMLFAGFLIMCIVCFLLREASKEVVEKQIGLFYSREIVVYNEAYSVGIIAGVLLATIAGCNLLVDFLSCGFQTVEANTHYITVYKGMTKYRVYINGEETGSIDRYSYDHVMDTKLPDGTKVCVAFCKHAGMLAHISFSDNNPSIDL